MVVAAGMQDLATAGLVWVTTQYAGLVEKQAVASEEAAEVLVTQLRPLSARPSRRSTGRRFRLVRSGESSSDLPARLREPSGN